jgi:hypothetical protein
MTFVSYEKESFISLLSCKFEHRRKRTSKFENPQAAAYALPRLLHKIRPSFTTSSQLRKPEHD